MDHEPESKSLRLELKAAGDGVPEGAFSATFATLNVIDHHGDVTLPGAYTEGQQVLIGAYQHEMGNLPVGKGVIHADDQRACIDGEFFLDTPHGEAAYRTVKNAGSVMEWSYIFTIEEADYGAFETGVGAVDVRFLKKLDVWSVDPVLRGAGIATRTDSIKGLEAIPFGKHADELATAVGAFADRVDRRAQMRAKDDRGLSADDRERLAALATGLEAARKRLADALADPGTNTSDDFDMQRERLKFMRAEAQIDGHLDEQSA